MIDRLILPPAVHLGVGRLVLVSNLIAILNHAATFTAPCPPSTSGTQKKAI